MAKFNREKAKSHVSSILKMRDEGKKLPWEIEKTPGEMRQEKWERFQDWTFRTMPLLIMVKVSMRRHVVVRVTGAGQSSTYATTPADQKADRIAAINGEIVFGPSPFQECRKYIEKHSPRVPEGLWD